MTVQDLPAPVAFVLGGGASLGAVQVGMLRALDESGVAPDLVVGTSVGALNGAVLAARPATAVERLTALWQRMRRQDVFPGTVVSALWRLRQQGTHLVEHEGLAHLLGSALDVAAFDELDIPLAVVAVDLESGRAHELDTGPLLPALMASAAIPGIFPPVRVGTRTLVDGGVVSNVPIAQALARGARSIVVLDCTVPGRAQGVHSLAGVADQINRIQMRMQVEWCLPQVVAHVPVVYLAAPPARSVTPYDFDQTAALIAEAHAACRDQLEGLVVDGPGIYGDPYPRYRGTVPASDAQLVPPTGGPSTA